MKLRLTLFALLLTVTACTGGTVPQEPAPRAREVYVEPTLESRQVETLAVIVTAGDAKQAAQAVERVGGTVTSELWIINAVAATIPADQLETLAADPEIISIVENKGVKTSQVPVDGWQPVKDRFATEKAWPMAMNGGVHLLDDKSITGK